MQWKEQVRMLMEIELGDMAFLICFVLVVRVSISFLCHVLWLFSLTAKRVLRKKDSFLLCRQVVHWAI